MMQFLRQMHSNSRRYHPQIESTLSQLNPLCPRFDLRNGQVEVLFSPAQFYETLKHKIRNSKQRIFLASLYIGKEQYELIDCLDEALTKNPGLKVSILTDALRSTREFNRSNHNNITLLKKLFDNHGDRVDVHLYHSPRLYGIRKSLVPRRFDEGIAGVQHLKLYGFDDEIILSGANLSKDYFTNRQDRYMVFKSKEMTDYFHAMFETVARLSYDVQRSKSTTNGFRVKWNHRIPEPTVDPVNYIKQATRQIAPLLLPSKDAFTSEHNSDSTITTTVYAMSQFTPLLIPNTSTEYPVMSRLFSMLATDRFNWTLTAGYFNIDSSLQQKLFCTTPSDFAHVITASPKANGFYKAPGLPGQLPGAYSLLAQQFLENTINSRVESKIKMLEWEHVKPQRWTYHAKGLWISPPHSALPCMTVVGSSNYTRRSYCHDIESNVVIVTRDHSLQNQFQTEVDNLKKHCHEMTIKDYNDEERKPNWFQKLFVKYMGDRL